MGEGVTTVQAPPRWLTGTFVHRLTDATRIVVASRAFAEGDIVEQSPVLAMSCADRAIVRTTVLQPYLLSWQDHDCAADELSACEHASATALVLGGGTFVGHSRHPNCLLRRDLATKTVDFLACRPIAPGDPITVDLAPSPVPSQAHSGSIPSPGLVLSEIANRTCIAESPGRGRGIYAWSEIEHREVFERTPVIVLPHADYKAVYQTVLHNYVFPWMRRDGTGALVLGHGMFYNHSFTPNADYAQLIDTEEMVFFALEHIAAGTEIRWNYRGPATGGGPLWFTPVPEDGDRPDGGSPPGSGAGRASPDL
jgi:uncharacterized protein